MKKKSLTVYRISCDGQTSLDNSKDRALENISHLMEYYGHPITVTTISMSKKKWNSLENFDDVWEI